MFSQDNTYLYKEYPSDDKTLYFLGGLIKCPNCWICWTSGGLKGHVWSYSLFYVNLLNVIYTLFCQSCSRPKFKQKSCTLNSPQLLLMVNDIVFDSRSFMHKLMIQNRLALKARCNLPLMLRFKNANPTFERLSLRK